MKPTETAEDRWEFNQQSEALYQARLEAKAALKHTLSPSPLPKSNAQEAHPSNHGGGDLPFVATQTGD
jgi:hypothetical protein